MSITGKTSVCELRDGAIESYEIEPEAMGLKRARSRRSREGPPKKMLRSCSGYFKENPALDRMSSFECSGRLQGGRQGFRSQRWGRDGQSIDRFGQGDGETESAGPFFEGEGVRPCSCKKSSG